MMCRESAAHCGSVSIHDFTSVRSAARGSPPDSSFARSNITRSPKSRITSSRLPSGDGTGLRCSRSETSSGRTVNVTASAQRFPWSGFFAGPLSGPLSDLDSGFASGCASPCLSAGTGSFAGSWAFGSAARSGSSSAVRSSRDRATVAA